MRALLALVLLAAAAWCADPPTATVAKVFDQQVTMLEKEIVPLAEAMPADKFEFAPTQGEFKGVRTFAQQISHTAAVIYMMSARVLGEKNPSEAGKDENGPAGLKTREDVIQYLKDSLVYAHKAMGSLTEKRLVTPVAVGSGNRKQMPLFFANVVLWHSFDHYGQMVVYARMNGIIPPASRK